MASDLDAAKILKNRFGAQKQLLDLKQFHQSALSFGNKMRWGWFSGMKKQGQFLLDNLMFALRRVVW
jgi:hypothetical protein